MKFLLVSPFTSASGSSIRFWNMARALVEQGHRVVLAERRAKGGTSLHRCKGVTYYSCPSFGILASDVAFSFAFYILVLVRHITCDAYYALKPAPNNCIPALAAKCLGKKILLDVDDLDFAYLKPGFGRTLFKRFFDGFPRFFDLVTYHTPRLADYLRQHTAVSPDKLYYFAQGVSPEFVDGWLIDEHGVPPKSIIYVATLGITSDFADMIPGLCALCAAHADVSVTVVGDGCRREEFERMADEGGIGKNVTFTGMLPHRELPALMARHRIGINYMRPSPVNQCRAILKIREYLACNLEVVCNDVGDVDLFREYIHIGTGTEAMFAALAGLLRLPPQTTTAGRDHIVKNYRWATLAEAFLVRVSAL